MNKAEQLKELQKKIEGTRTVYTNLKSFNDWNFTAYKIEAHEKDYVMEATSFFVNYLQQQADKLKEELNDDTELCE